MLEVRVPATGANLGPGFDAFGLAFQLYNTFRITEKRSGGLKITGVSKRYCNRENLFYRAMGKIFTRVCYHPKGLHVHCNNQIPFSRGMGSSASCIAGGMMAANVLSGRILTDEEVFEQAVKMEGHADNLAAAFYGGLTVSVTEGGKTTVMRNTVSDIYRFFAVIPNYPVWTGRSRQLLPEMIPFQDGAFNISRSVMTYLALIQGQPEKLRIVMEDRIHQPYRKVLIEDYDWIENHALKCGALSVCISGSGPTVLIILDQKSFRDFESDFVPLMTERHPKWQIMPLRPDDRGLKIIEKR